MGTATRAVTIAHRTREEPRRETILYGSGGRKNSSGGDTKESSADGLELKRKCGKGVALGKGKTRRIWEREEHW